MQLGPQAIADLFAAPPAETRALLDPGNDAALPAWTAPAAPAPPPEWTLTDEETLGAWALYLATANGDLTGQADLHARAWRGDRLWVYAGNGTAAITSALVWRIACADAATATDVAQSLPSRFSRRVFGAEVVVAAADSGGTVDWAFEPLAANAPAPEDDGVARAPGRSAADWLARIFTRAGH
jgi:hypothetical protein